MVRVSPGVVRALIEDIVCAFGTVEEDGCPTIAEPYHDDEARQQTVEFLHAVARFAARFQSDIDRQFRGIEARYEPIRITTATLSAAASDLANYLAKEEVEHERR